MRRSRLLKSHLEFCSRRRNFRDVTAIPELRGTGCSLTSLAWQGVELLNTDQFVAWHDAFTWAEHGRAKVGITPPFPEKRRAAHLRGLYRFSVGETELGEVTKWPRNGSSGDIKLGSTSWSLPTRRGSQAPRATLHQDLVHTFCSMVKPQVCVEAGQHGTMTRSNSGLAWPNMTV